MRVRVKMKVNAKVRAWVGVWVKCGLSEEFGYRSISGVRFGLWNEDEDGGEGNVIK